MEGLLKVITIFFITGVRANSQAFLTGRECLNQNHGDHIPYPGNCTKYLVCEYFTGTVMLCPSGLHFNPLLQVCSSQASADCSQDGGSSTPPSTESAITLETIPTMRPEHNVCHGKTNGTLSPYPYDCDWYIRCEDYSPLVLRCAEGRQFNAVLLICDYPENVHCIATPYPTIATEPPTKPPTQTPTESPTLPLTEPPTQPPTQLPTQPPTEPPTDPPTQPPTQSPTEIIPTLKPDENICIGKGNGSLAPYPYNCDWYIRCEDYSPLVLRFAKGRQFNAVLLICDYPENVHCIATPYPTITTEPPTKPPTQTPTQPPTQPPTGPPTHSTNGVCQGHKPGDLLPYPGQCRKYIQCEIPVPYAKTCANGFHFNAKLSICDDPETAECEIVVPTTQPPSSGSNICCGAENGSLVAYPDDCTQYIQCIYPIPIAIQCDNGLHYNSIGQTCESIENAARPIPPPTTIAAVTCVEDKEDGTEVLPYSEECKQYY